MKYRGVETENYTEREFIALSGFDRSSLVKAKKLGAEFKPAPEFAPDVIPRRVQESLKYNQSLRGKIRKDPDFNPLAHNSVFRKPEDD